MKTLWKHQEKAVGLALKQKNFALFHEIGTGKTGTLINILRYKFHEKGHVRKTLIISPLITLQNWKKEFSEFSQIKESDIEILKGTGKQKFKQCVKAITDPKTMTLTRNRIIIMNYEAVQNEELLNVLAAWRPEILVCDEAHRLRNHKSKRAKIIAGLSDLCDHRYILTGTPILNDEQDIFHQYRVLDGGATFGANFYAFRNRYFVDKNANWQQKPGYFPEYVVRPDTHKELQRKIYGTPGGLPLASRVLKKDCLDLPPLVKVSHFVELSKDQRKMYTEMRDQFLTYVEELKGGGQPKAVIANMAITKALRLQQITSGFVKAEDGIEYEVKDNPRLLALKELLEDCCGNGKVIVWACFKRNYTQIARVCEDLKLSYRELHGDISADQKQIAMHDFRQDKNIKVMIANQGAGGIGVNLVEAPVSIFYSRNFSLEQDLQAEGRNYRGGSNIHEKVTRIDLIARNSIDEIVSEVLSDKQDISDIILDLKGRI